MRKEAPCAIEDIPMKSDQQILQLPQPIIDRLREVIGRIRRLQWIKGSLLTLAAAVSAVLVAMALDAAFSLEALPLRVAVSGAGLAFTAWIGWTQWLRPLCRKISLTAVARWIETRHPELHERISTAVELLDAGHGADGQGSRELLEAVVQDAVADVGRMDPAQELSGRRTLGAKWLAGSSVAVLLVIAAIWPQQVPRLLARALAPMADVGNAWADRLRVLTTSKVVAIGDPLSIEVALRGRSERVELQMTGPEGKTVVEMLLPDGGVAVQPGEQGYALRMPSVNQGFTARVVAGKAVSAGFTIKAVPRPETGSLTLTYHYPDYTGLPDAVKTNASGEVVALAGTRVTVTASLSRPVAMASVMIGETAVPGVQLSGGADAPGVAWTTVLTPNLDSLWSLHLEGRDGIANRPVNFPIRALTDLPPVITLETPVEERLELRPVEKVALTYSVKEDSALSTVQIRIRPQDKPEYLLPPQGMPDKVADSPDEYRGTAVLDLAGVPVPDGQEIRVSLMAADRMPPEMQGPQRSYSREIVIKLNRWTRPLIESNFEAQHQELRQKMEDVKRELQNAKGRLHDKPDRLKQEEKLSDNTLGDIETSAKHMEEAQAQLKDLTERIKETAYARQTPSLQEIARNMVQPAKEQTKEIPVTDQKDARAGLAKNARDLLENAIQKLEQEQQQMDQDRQAVQQVAQLSDLAEQQQRLAAEAADAANPASTPPPAAAPGASPDNPQSSPPPPAGDPSSAAPQEAAASGQAAPPPAPPPTDDEQRKWLEEQRRVAERAKQLMQESQNTNPLALQEQLKQAAELAAKLAAEADALAQKETGLAGTLAAAAPENMPQHAQAQQELAMEVAALQEKARGFQQASAKQIDQSTETQEAAHLAQSSLEDAAGQARQSGQELTAAAQTPPASSPPASPAAENPAVAAAGAPPEASSPAPAPAEVQDPAPQPGTAEGQGKVSAVGEPAPAPVSGDPAAPGDGAAPGSPSPPDVTAPGGQSPAGSSPQAPPATPSSPPATGQQAAEDSAQSLAEAAQALKSLGGELHSLAGMVAGHNKSLGEGARQAGTAVNEAVKPQNEQGKAPSMQQAATAAQQAADQLAMAASTAMQSRSIPASAKSSQASAPSRGKGKPQDGQPKPSGEPGQDGKDGLQMDTASSALPEELAKLGLTQDDWIKLRSALNGVDGTSSEQVPAEYRDLVKAYFGALAKGEKAK